MCIRDSPTPPPTTPHGKAIAPTPAEPCPNDASRKSGTRFLGKVQQRGGRSVRSCSTRATQAPDAGQRNLQEKTQATAGTEGTRRRPLET
eukprot:10484101-Alexandrium_andersonii.AAC.1